MCIAHLSITIKRGHKLHSDFCNEKNPKPQQKAPASIFEKQFQCIVFVLISLSLKVEKGIDSGSHTDRLGSVSLCPRARHVPTLNKKFSQYSNYNLYFNSAIYCEKRAVGIKRL